jgi:hypothetical protein
MIATGAIRLMALLEKVGVVKCGNTALAILLALMHT